MDGDHTRSIVGSAGIPVYPEISKMSLPDGVIPVNHRNAEIWGILRVSGQEIVDFREILRVSGQEIAIFGDFS